MVNKKRNPILIVIPARGGSKGIPHKNLRLVGGKPLITYAINTALSIEGATVVVSTDDDLIAEVARVYGALPMIRPKELAGDEVPLDPVIRYTLEKAEDILKKTFSTVITIQPTSPLLKAATLQKAIDKFFLEETETLISVKEKRHLFWIKEDGKIRPFYPERKNRQYLEPIFEETGSFVISNARLLRKKGIRISDSPSIYILPTEEDLDIDQWQQLVIADLMLNRLKIAIRVEGSKEIGMGHIYRGLTLAEYLPEHDITFYTNSTMKAGYEKLKTHTFPLKTYQNEEEFFQRLQEDSPNILINDILDTTEEYMKRLKNLGIFTVNFEDLGNGAKMADLLINALYEWSGDSPNAYFGYKYECLRSEFYFYPIKRETAEFPRKILVTFGGSDPANLTDRLLNNIEKIFTTEMKITIITGLAYDRIETARQKAIEWKKKGYDIEIITNSPIMARYMYEADLIITSNGRTVYEAVSSATPTISIAQNMRETTHLFSRICPGVEFLGLATELSDEELINKIRSIIRDPKKRKQMNRELQHYAIDIRRGKDRIKELIINNYREKKDAT